MENNFNFENTLEGEDDLMDEGGEIRCKVCELYYCKRNKPLNRFFEMLHKVNCYQSYNIISKETLQYYNGSVYTNNNFLKKWNKKLHPRLNEIDIIKHLQFCNISPKQIIRSDFHFCASLGNHYKSRINRIVNNDGDDEMESNLQLYSDLFTSNLNNKLKLYAILHKKI